MSKFIKTFLIIFSSAFLLSCASSKNNEVKKSAKSRAAQDRINAGQSGADSITKELDSKKE